MVRMQRGFSIQLSQLQNLDQAKNDRREENYVTPGLPFRLIQFSSASVRESLRRVRKERIETLLSVCAICGLFLPHLLRSLVD